MTYIVLFIVCLGCSVFWHKRCYLKSQNIGLEPQLVSVHVIILKGVCEKHNVVIPFFIYQLLEETSSSEEMSEEEYVPDCESDSDIS